MKGSKRVFNLKCENKTEYDEWVSKLKHSIKTSLGLQKELKMDFY